MRDWVKAFVYAAATIAAAGLIALLAKALGWF